MGYLMRTFTNVYGQSVFDLGTGQELGKIEDLYIDHKTGKIIGLVIDKKGWFNQDMLLPIESIKQFGTDGIMISSKNVLKPFRKGSVSFAEGKKRLKGKPLLTAEGEKLGLVEDVYFMEEMGNIVGYEVTEGLIADIKEGKKVVKTKNPPTIGEEVLIVEI